MSRDDKHLTYVYVTDASISLSPPAPEGRESGLRLRNFLFHFFQGFGSVIDLTGTRMIYRFHPRADRDAVLQDWMRVGQDLRRAAAKQADDQPTE